jgi:hypothetical protein
MAFDNVEHGLQKHGAEDVKLHVSLLCSERTYHAFSLLVLRRHEDKESKHC